jgi:hypothetical protein
MSAPAMALDFDAFVHGIASVIAEHVAGDAGGDTPTAAPAAVPLAAIATMARMATLASMPTGATPRLPALAFVLDHEKIVWHFPDAASRIIEEMP